MISFLPVLQALSIVALAIMVVWSIVQTVKYFKERKK